MALDRAGLRRDPRAVVVRAFSRVLELVANDPGTSREQIRNQRWQAIAGRLRGHGYAAGARCGDRRAVSVRNDLRLLSGVASAEIDNIWAKPDPRSRRATEQRGTHARATPFVAGVTL